MMSHSLKRSCRPSWSNARHRPSVAPSTCVWMRATKAPAFKIIESHGYIAHVVSRSKEKEAKQRHPDKKARRWVVEVCHSWFNRFRKLLVRYEKLERSFLALNHLAAGIIAFRKVRLSINIIYG
jgi:transposase